MSDEQTMTATQVKTKTVSKTAMALAVAFLGISAIAAAAAGVPLLKIIKKPDLIINKIVIASPTIDGIPYTINYSNRGSAVAKGPFYIGLIAQDSNYNELALGLNEITTPGYKQQIVKNYVSAKFSKLSFPTLPNGTGVIKGNIPWSLVNRGMKKFTAKIDMGEAVAESVENNNKFLVDLPNLATTTPVGLPDLVIDQITFVSTTESIDFSLKYSNRGDAPASGPFHIGFVAQDNNYIEIPVVFNEISTPDYNQEVIFGYQSAKFDKSSFPTLPNGIGEIKGSIPMSLISNGMTKLIAKIDMGEVVNESIENNNKFSVDIPANFIYTSKPDLVVTNMVLTPQNDGSLQYKLEYANQGTASVNGPFYIGIIPQKSDYTELSLVLDTITSVGYTQEMIGNYVGIKFAKASFPTLPNGTGVVVGIIPKTLIDQGMAKFSIKIDIGDNVAESVETNNKFSVDLPASVISKAKPDLVITNIVLTTQTNGSVQYKMEYANQGASSAIGSFYIGIIAQTSDYTELPLQPGTITSNDYTQEMIGNYVGIKYSKAEFVPSPNGTGVVFGVIPKSLIDQGMVKFNAKIDMGENIDEVMETNNKYFVDIPQVMFSNSTST